MSFDELWDLPQPVVMPVDVTEEHIDGLGHVNNLKYIEWCGRCAWQHSRGLGLDLKACHGLDRAMAVRETRVFHLLAAYLGDELLVGNWIVYADRLRVTRRYQILRAGDRATVLRGFQKFVCIQLSNGVARRMPRVFEEVYRVDPAVSAALESVRALPSER